MQARSWTKNAEQIKKIEQTLHAPIFADARSDGSPCNI